MGSLPLFYWVRDVTIRSTIYDYDDFMFRIVHCTSNMYDNHCTNECFSFLFGYIQIIPRARVPICLCQLVRYKVS